MGQILHGSAATTEAVRRAIQESLRTLAKRYGINQKTVAKWKKRTSVTDLPTGAKEQRSTVLSVEEEAVIVAFRRYTLLPLDDCLYALQSTIPQLTRSPPSLRFAAGQLLRAPRGRLKCYFRRNHRWPCQYASVHQRILAGRWLTDAITRRASRSPAARMHVSAASSGRPGVRRSHDRQFWVLGHHHVFRFADRSRWFWRARALGTDHPG